MGSEMCIRDRFGHQVQNLLTTLTATPNRTTLQRIKEVQKKIEDKLLDIEAVQHALIDICEQNLAINSLTDQKMKAELMKVANPTIKTLRERAEDVQREAREIAYGESGPNQTKSKAYVESGS